MTSAPAATAEPEELADPLPPVRGTVKRLLGWSIPANFAVFLIWGSVAFLLLPLQVQGFGEADKVANLLVITTIGALAAMFAQPIAGAALRPHPIAFRTARAVDGGWRARRWARARRNGLRELADSDHGRLGRRAGRLQLHAGAALRDPSRPHPARRAGNLLRRWSASARCSAPSAARPSDRRSRQNIGAGYFVVAGFALVAIVAVRRVQPGPLERRRAAREVRPQGLRRHLLGEPAQASRLLLGVHRAAAALHRLLRRDRLPALHPSGLHRPGYSPPRSPSCPWQVS